LISKHMTSLLVRRAPLQLLTNDSVDAVGGGLVLPTLGNGCSEVLEHSLGRLPVYAGVGDGDTLLQAAGSLWRYLLVALVDVGLDHDADDAGLATADLVGNVLGYLGLVSVILARVTLRSC
jgi:hypothetical protein